MTNRPVYRKTVWSGQCTCRHIGNAGAMGPNIAALIEIKLVIQPDDFTILCHSGANYMALLAGMVSSHQMFASVFNPFYRPAQSHGGDTNQNIFRIKLATNTKSATGMTFEQMDARGWSIEHPAQRIPVTMRDLCCAIHFKDVAGFIITTNRATTFHGNTGVTADLYVDFHHLIGVSESFVDVAIALFNDGGFGCCLTLEILRRVIGVDQYR